MSWRTTAGLKLTSATILSGQTTSGEIDLGGAVPVGFHLPAAMTGTTLTFLAAQASTANGGTYQVVKDDAGNTVTLTIAGGRFVQVPPTMLCGVQFLKIVGSSQAADRVIKIARRPY